MDYEIEDVIQKNLDMSSYFLIKDIVLLIIVFILYSSLDFNWIIVSIKAFFIIIVLRYIISYLTTINLMFIPNLTMCGSRPIRLLLIEQCPCYSISSA